MLHVQKGRSIIEAERDEEINAGLLVNVSFAPPYFRRWASYAFASKQTSGPFSQMAAMRPVSDLHFNFVDVNQFLNRHPLAITAPIVSVKPWDAGNNRRRQIGGGMTVPQINIASEESSGTPVPDLSIAVDDLDDALERAKATGLNI
jgi:hypothetical protein